MMRTQQDKKKLSLYVTDSEKALLDKLSETWGCSNNQAVIRAIKIATNTPIDNPNDTPINTPTHTVNVGLSKEDIELLIEEKVELLVYQKIELLVNSRIELLENQGEENAKKFKVLDDAIANLTLEVNSLQPEQNPDLGGLQGQELAALISEQGVNCRSEYLSLYRKGRHIPPKLKEILDRDWIAKGKYWYPKQPTP